MYWCPDVCIYPQKSIWIWKVYLNFSKCTWKVSILLYSNQTLGCLRLYGDSRVSPAQPRINAYEILLQYYWLLIFSRHNRFAEKHSHLQLSYHITDRLLAAVNEFSRAYRSPLWSQSNKNNLAILLSVYFCRSWKPFQARSGDLMTWFRAIKASMQSGCKCYCVLSTTMKNPHFHWLIH